MTTNPKLIPLLAELIQHAKTLQYKNRYGTLVKVHIQPLAQLDKLNADTGTLAKMRESGAQDALVIGADEAGIPILISCLTLKTYLLDPAMPTPGSYLKNEITISH
jgi:hypothetical protein